MTSQADRSQTISLLLFRIGQLILVTGYMCFMIGVYTNYWVVRPYVNYEKVRIDPTKVDVVKHYGIFSACRQSSNSNASIGECGSLPSNMNFVDDNAIRLVQALMVIAFILYICGFVVEILQLVPHKYRNFLAENRVVEMFSGIATVLALVAMVIYAGEIKNKAELIPGQEDEKVGWSFTIAIVGLSFCIIGLLNITMFRHLPTQSGDSHQLGGSWLRTKRNMNGIR